jgi:ubiquinone/menaquinone biosynthesis C-methylase UbiE
MNLYERWILPPILDLIMRQKHLVKYRRAVVAAARGRVLEIGVGSGLNFPLYGKQVELVYGIDPSPRLLAVARRRAAASPVPVELLLGSATAIPLADNAVDTVVMTWTLCSIPGPLAALREMRRVLKPNGNLIGGGNQSPHENLFAGEAYFNVKEMPQHSGGDHRRDETAE